MSISKHEVLARQRLPTPDVPAKSACFPSFAALPRPRNVLSMPVLADNLSLPVGPVADAW
jgi:hypothetical protein